jgi:GTP-binding protein EngB required for normal cell division
MASNEFPLHLLLSKEQVQLLDDIDKLRGDGLQYHEISLPQLVVCGDQSSGKSSVLEALSNVKFPVDSGTCTRFAMELALCRSSNKRATAKIIPGKTTLGDRRKRLAGFKPSHVGLADVPELIKEAQIEMLLSGNAICDDVLRLEITGPDLPHLTLVDLPGLIADAKDTRDIELVENMVRRYMKCSRSIILAIVSAQSDKQIQKVLRLAREIDPHGHRTVGVITKPDMLKNYRGSTLECNYLKMAKNLDPVSKLRLGWHVVRNPDYHEKWPGSKYDRDEEEKELFSQEPWNELSKRQLGIRSLRDELTKHLFNQICTELPRLVTDIEREKAKCEQELTDLGKANITSKDQRGHLIAISGRFQQLVGAALDGNWTSDPIFQAEDMRLRAQIRNLNDEFEKTIRRIGHTTEFKPGNKEWLETSSGLTVNLFSSRGLLLSKVTELLKSGRGRQLPGMFDPALVSDIFRYQSQNWPNLASAHLENVWQVTSSFLEHLLIKMTHVRSYTAETLLNGIIADEMLSRKKALGDKCRELLTPYVRNLPFCTSSRMAASLKQLELEEAKAEQAGSPMPAGATWMNTDIDIDTCLMVLRYTEAYYNIARETFIENIATLAVENCLLTGLANIFPSNMVLEMDDIQLMRFAGDSDKLRSDRRHAEAKHQLLEKSLETCRAHMSRRLFPIRDSQKKLPGWHVSSDVNNSASGAPVETTTLSDEPHKGIFSGTPAATLDGSIKQASGTSSNASAGFGGQLSASGSSLFSTSSPSSRPNSSSGSAALSPFRLFGNAADATTGGFGVSSQNTNTATCPQSNFFTSSSLSPNIPSTTICPQSSLFSTPANNATSPSLSPNIPNTATRPQSSLFSTPANNATSPSLSPNIPNTATRPQSSLFSTPANNATSPSLSPNIPNTATRPQSSLFSTPANNTTSPSLSPNIPDTATRPQNSLFGAPVNNTTTSSLSPNIPAKADTTGRQSPSIG